MTCGNEIYCARGGADHVRGLRIEKCVHEYVPDAHHPVRSSFNCSLVNTPMDSTLIEFMAAWFFSLLLLDDVLSVAAARRLTISSPLARCVSPV